MTGSYVHGYDAREQERLRDQAGTLVDLLHGDTAYPPGSRVLEAGCGVGAQTVTLARRSPGARFQSIDVSADSIAEAEQRVRRAGLTNVEFCPADIFASRATMARPTFTPRAPRPMRRSAARSSCSGGRAATRWSAASCIRCW